MITGFLWEVPESSRHQLFLMESNYLVIIDLISVDAFAKAAVDEPSSTEFFFFFTEFKGIKRTKDAAMGGPGTGSKIGLHCGTSANATRPRFAKTFFFFFFATGPQQNFDNKMFAKRNQKK